MQTNSANGKHTLGHMSRTANGKPQTHETFWSP